MAIAYNIWLDQELNFLELFENLFFNHWQYFASNYKHKYKNILNENLKIIVMYTGVVCLTKY